jgi:protease-4
VRAFHATCLLLALGTFVGCRHPIRAITSNTIFVPRPISARITSVIEQRPKTEPIQCTVVSQGPAHQGGPRVALIDVDGLLVNAEVNRTLQDVDNPVALFREKLDAASKDPDVCAYVVRINSPGGGVVASDLMFHELEKLRERTGRPIVTYVMDIGTGGAYYLATAGDLILAHPNAVTGGIGVIFNYYNLSDSMGQHGAYHRPIVAGENITMGTYTDELSDETLEWFQEMADEFHGRFKDIVYRRRPTVDREEKSTVDGRVFAAGQAKRRQLIDQVGYLEEAIATAEELAGTPDCAVVMYHRNYNTPRSIYADDGLNPVPTQMSPLSLPGLERSHLPSFLYIWQVDPALERLGKP